MKPHFPQDDLGVQQLMDTIEQVQTSDKSSSSKNAHSPVWTFDHDHLEPSESDGEEERPSNPLGLIFRTLRGRYLVVAILSVLLAVIGGLAGYSAKASVFVSNGIIQIFAHRAGILYDNSDDSRLRLFDAFVASEMSFLMSSSVLERAAASPELSKYNWPAETEGVNRIRSVTKAEKKGGLITLSTGAEDPQLAAAITNSILDAFESIHTEEARRVDSFRQKELAQRESELLEKLKDLAAKLLKVGQEHGTNSISGAHVRKISQVEDLDHRIHELTTSIASTEEGKEPDRAAAVDAEIKRLTVLDQAMADMLFERTKRSAELAILETRHAGEHRSIVEAREGIRVVERGIEERRQQLAALGATGALTKTGEPDKGNARREMVSLRDRFIARRAELQEEAVQLNARLVELDFLRREHDETRQVLADTRRGLEQVRVESRNSLPGTFEVKSRGAVPLHPAADKRATFAMAGAGMGGISGLGLTLLLGLVFRKYRFSDDLESLPLAGKVVGTIPATRSREGAVDRKFDRAIQDLRVELQHQRQNGKDHHVLAITSVRSAAGTSTVTLALARAYANSRLRTLVIDADLIDSSLSKRLGLDQERGFREGILEGSSVGVSHRTQQDFLTALPAGKAASLTDEQVARKQFAHLLREVRADYDLVIIDLGAFPERLVARVGAALADQLLVVVPAGDEAHVVESTLAAVNRVAPKKVVSILNFASRRDPRLVGLRLV